MDKTKTTLARCVDFNSMSHFTKKIIPGKGQCRNMPCLRHGVTAYAENPELSNIVFLSEVFGVVESVAFNASSSARKMVMVILSVFVLYQELIITYTSM